MYKHVYFDKLSPYPYILIYISDFFKETIKCFESYSILLGNISYYLVSWKQKGGFVCW